MELEGYSDFYYGGGIGTSGRPHNPNKSEANATYSTDAKPVVTSITRSEYDQLNLNDKKRSYLIMDDKVITSNSINYSPSTVTTIFPTVTDGFSEMKEELDKLKESMNRKLNITMMHGCRNCGAQLELDIDKPVIHCKHCGTAYVIGQLQLHSTY